METASIASDAHRRAYDATARRITRKLDLHIVPPLTFLYLSAFIDRSNIGNARVAGLERDLGLHGLQFNTCLVVFFITYILVELPSNYALKRFGGKKWLPGLVFCWGVVTICSGWVSSYAGLIIARLCLGLCEGGILPGFVLYLSTLYPRHELQFRVGLFYSAAGMSGAFGGLLAYAIQRMDGKGGRPGWAWIFILEGIATCLIVISAWIVLPDSLASANFLTPEERDFAIKRFRADFIQQSAPLSEGADPTSTFDSGDRLVHPDHADPDSPGGKKTLDQVVEQETANDAEVDAVSYKEPFEWRELRRGFKDPQVWMTGFGCMGIGVALFSYSLFLPTIIAGMGYTGIQAQLFSAWPYIPASVVAIAVAYLCDRLKLRQPFVLVLLPITMVGYIMQIAATRTSVRYAAVFLMAIGTYSSVPALFSLIANNTAGMTKRACVTAWQIAFSNAAGFIASFSYLPDEAPRYTSGHAVALSFIVLAWLVVGCNVLYCFRENKARAAGRRNDEVEKWRQLVKDGKTRAPLGDRDPRFRFTI